MKHVDAHTIGYNTIFPQTTNNGTVYTNESYYSWIGCV